MAEQIEEMPLNLAAIEVGVTRERLIRLVQRGVVRGRFDPTRPMNSGRWYVMRLEVERLIAERAQATALAKRA